MVRRQQGLRDGCIAGSVANLVATTTVQTTQGLPIDTSMHPANQLLSSWREQLAWGPAVRAFCPTHCRSAKHVRSCTHTYTDTLDYNNNRAICEAISVRQACCRARLQSSPYNEDDVVAPFSSGFEASRDRVPVLLTLIYSCQHTQILQK